MFDKAVARRIKAQTPSNLCLDYPLHTEGGEVAAVFRLY
jgi:hypothetical protein